MTRYSLFWILFALPLASACQTQSQAPIQSAMPAVSMAADDPANEGTWVDDPSADATGIPDLTGIWTARLRSIYRGVGPLGLGISEGADIDYLRLTIDIEIQDGRLFYGTIRSQTQGDETGQSNEIFGAIRSDGKRAIYITREGRGEMTFMSDDEIEVCGGRGDADVMLAFCSPLRRAGSP